MLSKNFDFLTFPSWKSHAQLCLALESFLFLTCFDLRWHVSKMLFFYFSAEYFLLFSFRVQCVSKHWKIMKHFAENWTNDSSFELQIKDNIIEKGAAQESCPRKKRQTGVSSLCRSKRMGKKWWFLQSNNSVPSAKKYCTQCATAESRKMQRSTR